MVAQADRNAHQGATSSAPGVVVHGNVEGSIQVGDNNVQVNDNHGSIIFNRIEATRRQRPAGPPPRVARPFVGRAAELQEIASEIAAAGANRAPVAICVSGQDGAGRTALLRKVANDTAAAGGTLLVEGVGATGEGLSPNDIAQRLYNQVWATDPPEKVTVETARVELGELRALALIDEMTLSDDAIVQIADLLPRGAILMATHRPPYGTDLLDVPIGALPRSDAVILLAARAGITQGTDGSALDAICALLADWPGALAVAGKAMAIRSIAPAAALSALGVVAPLAESVHLAAIERAYALAEPALDGNARLMLATAANLPGLTADPGVLRRVLGEPAWFDEAAERLRALELLRLNSPRFRIEPGLRAVVGRTIDPEPVRDRYVEVALSELAERRLDWEFSGPELGGLIESLGRDAQRGNVDGTIALGRALDPYLVLHGLWDLAVGVLQAVRSLDQRLLGPGDLAWTNHELGTLALAIGDREAARRLLGAALDVRQRIGDIEGAAYTQHNLDRLGPPPTDGHRDDNGGKGSGGGTKAGRGRLPVVAVIAALLILLVVPNGPGTALAAFVGRLLTGSADPTPPPAVTAAPGMTVAPPTPVVSTPDASVEVPTQTPIVTQAPGDIQIQTRDLNNYVLDWGSWTGMFEITASGGSDTYSFTISSQYSGQQNRDVNPAEFTIIGVGCGGERATGTASSPGANDASIDVTMRPPDCGTPPGLPVPNGPKAPSSCEGPAYLSWSDGGGNVPRRYELVVTHSPDNTTYAEIYRQVIDGFGQDVETKQCGTYRWTVEAVDQLDQRSGPVQGLEFTESPPPTQNPVYTDPPIYLR